MLKRIDEQRTIAPPDVVHAHVEALEPENAQLQQALNSRIVIEQAKGVLIERSRVEPADAFELLRPAARSQQRRIHDLVTEVVTSRCSPSLIQAFAVELVARERAGVPHG